MTAPFSKNEQYLRDFVAMDGMFFLYAEPSVASVAIKSPLLRSTKIDAGFVQASINSGNQLLHCVEQHEARPAAQQSKPLGRVHSLVFIDTANKPDAVLTMEKLSKHHPEVPIIAVTADLSTQPVEERQAWYLFYAENGARYVISLPIAADQVLKLAGRAVRPPDDLEQAVLKGERVFREWETRGEDLPLPASEAQQLYTLAQHVLDVRPKYPRALALRGAALNALGRTAEAVVDLEAARALGHFAANQTIIDIHKQNGRLDRAGQLLAQIRRFSSRNPNHVIAQGEIALAQGNGNAAQVFFSQAENITNGLARKMGAKMRADTALKIVDACINAGAGEDAARYLYKAVDHGGGQIGEATEDYFIKLGVLFCRQGLFVRAVQEYEKAMRLKPDDPILCYNLAKAYYEWSLHQKKAGQGQEAEEKAAKAYRTLCDTDELNEAGCAKKRSRGDFFGVNITVCLNIAQMFYRFGNGKLAKKYIDKGIGIDSHSAQLDKVLVEIAGEDQAREYLATARGRAA